jgi:GT2 family glycosyltransferase
MNEKGAYIIVCYNNEKEVLTFIENVLLNQTIDLDIFVVANKMNNNEGFINLNNVKILYPEKNLGYLGALNYVYNKIELSSYLFICLSNTDLEFNSTKLLSNLSKKFIDNLVALVSPTILCKNRNQNPSLFIRPTKFKMFLIYVLTFFPSIFLLKKWIQSLSRNNYQITYRDYSCYALHGSFLMFSNKHISKFDFNHTQLLYGEEIRIAEQSRKMGLVSIWSDTEIIYHNENSTTSLIGIRNKLRYIRKYTKDFINQKDRL